MLLALTSCATAPPTNTANSCAIFQQRGGLVNNWRDAAERTQREFGVPVPVLMATIQAESNFEQHARPARTKLMGFIPWKRRSTAYGYAQALDGTWREYQKATSRPFASRSNFSDAVHFVGWYHNNSNRRNGIARNDTYRLYLAYYHGHAGYARGNWRNNTRIQQAAQRTARMSDRYAAQLQNCR
nr:transglycosylase SLT domain-containing protein [Aureimonas fodinaquatilis]